MQHEGIIRFRVYKPLLERSQDIECASPRPIDGPALRFVDLEVAMIAIFPFGVSIIFIVVD